MSDVIDADPQELRQLASQLAQAGEYMKNASSAMVNEWDFLTSCYRDPDSVSIGESLRAILQNIDRLSPRIDAASQQFNAYASWLEGN